MANQDEPGKVDPDKLERLRERTDEIELIISGLTILALFTLPGWLFDQLIQYLTHLSQPLFVGGALFVMLATGMCYVLGACFVLHLLTRAYWIGLIGLKTVFPQGIDWSRTPGIGPLTGTHYRSHLPDLKAAIMSADRLASSLFAVISLIAVSILWVGIIMVSTVLISGLVGAWIGDAERGVAVGVNLILAVGVGIPTLLWFLDAQIGARWPRLASKPWFARLIKVLARLSGYIVPQRLILPVQLTLQSNTRPIMFIAMLSAGMVAIVLIGQNRWEGWRQFTVFGEFRYMDQQVLDQGIISSHYEAWRGPKDRARPWPMISAFEQSADQVRLFLPYLPARDNRILDRLCPESPHPDDPVACMRLIWQVEINGEPVSLDGFLPTERMDLNLRGLTGLVPMTQLSPGLHRIEILHNPLEQRSDHDDAAAEGVESEDDRSSGLRFHIPFKFAPEYELELDDSAADAEEIEPT